jgi:hypothetical protein
MSCLLCQSRKARRPCPATEGDICPQCCAEQREEKLDCPLTCEFLRESRKHEKYVAVPKSETPHPEVKLTEDFLSRNDLLTQFLSVAVRDAALSTPGSTDADLREAVDAIVQTFKTADSGLIYETRPANPFAASIQEKVNTQIEELKNQLGERGGVALRDKDLLGVMVFLARVAISLNNGKRKGRSFMAMLLERFPAPKEKIAADGGGGGEPAPSGLIIA